MKRGTSENQTVARGVISREGNRQLRLSVLHSVTFVDDHMNPLDLGEQRSIFDDVFVRRKQDLELSLANFPLRLFSLGRRPLVRNHLDGRSPLFELHDPIRHRRKGNDDEERTVLLLRFDEEGDEGDGLNRLSESLLQWQETQVRMELVRLKRRRLLTISSARIPLT